MPPNPLRRFLRRGLDDLQQHLRSDLTLRDGGLLRARGGYTVWLECEGASAAVWRGQGRVPRGAIRRGLQLALADALADIAGRSGAGLMIWKR